MSSHKGVIAGFLVAFAAVFAIGAGVQKFSNPITAPSYTATASPGFTGDGSGLTGTVDSTALHTGSDGSSLTGLTKAQVGLGNVVNVDTTNAANISSNTLPTARFPGGAFNGASELVQLTAATKYPALDGSLITSLDAGNLGSGIMPDGRFPATLPAMSGINLTALNGSNLGSGSVPAARLPAASLTSALPNRWWANHFSSTSTAGAAIIHDSVPASMPPVYRSQTPANTDRWSQTFTMQAGTYSLYVLGWKVSNGGKQEMYVDGNLVGTIDWYSASSVVNSINGQSINTNTSSISFTITDGTHTLEARQVTRNVSSSGEFVLLNSMWIK